MKRPDPITLSNLRNALPTALARQKEAARKKITPADENLFLGLALIPIVWVVLAIQTQAAWGGGWKALFALAVLLGHAVLAAITWAIVEAKTERKMMKVWLAVAVLEGGLWAWLLEPAWPAAVGAAASVLYGGYRAVRATDEAPGSTAVDAPLWGLPEAALTLIPELEALPTQAEKAVDAALEDYLHFVEALEGSSQAAQVEALQQLRSEASRTLEALLQHARKVANLHRIAEQRRDDAAAQEAVAVALERLSAMGSSLDAAASAAIRFVAQEDRGAVGELEQLAENLRHYTAAQAELSAVTTGRR